jgi:hypothetical protein
MLTILPELCAKTEETKIKAQTNEKSKVFIINKIKTIKHTTLDNTPLSWPK